MDDKSYFLSYNKNRNADATMKKGGGVSKDRKIHQSGAGTGTTKFV